MELNQKIFNYLARESKLSCEAQILDYAMNRKKQILENHFKNVCRLYAPGEGGTKYYSTKLEPKNRKNQRQVFSTTLEGLEAKIVAYYLTIEEDRKITVRNILLKAVDENDATGKRTIQRFDKHFSAIGKIPISRLTENDIRVALNTLLEERISNKEFNQAITSLNKIADYCNYEHIDAINIREIIALYRKVKITGKHLFKDVKKETKNLAFTRAESARIVRHAIRTPSYKNLSVALLIITGVRVGELLALMVEDIYIKEGYIWIHQIEDSKTFELYDYVKENKSREVFLSDEAIELMRIALDFRAKDQTQSPYLLLNKNAKDGKMHLRAIDDYMRRHIHKDVLGYGTDRECRSPHDCRRTYASLEYLNGTDIYTLMNQLGHASITQTEEYIHDVIDAAERRNRLRGTGILLDIENKRMVNANERTKKIQ